MTDAIPKTEQHFQEAGLATDRFVAVKDGGKMCVDHDTRYDAPSEVPGQNYGIYAAEEDQLVVLDVDYYGDDSEEASTVAMAALSALPRTLKIESPHVPEGDRGGHRIYKLAGDETPAELFKRRFGAQNPVPSWGEVVSKNKYVVGPGSKLDGCSKDHCEECELPQYGKYKIKKDRTIATVEPDTLVEALAADPDLSDSESENDVQTVAEVAGASSGGSTSESGDYEEFDRETVEEMLDALPGNQHFDDWIRTGYAVYDWNSGTTGKKVFENWSRSNAKWEEQDSQRQIDYIWNNGTSGDGKGSASIGTLVYLAQQHGWTPSGRRVDDAMEKATEAAESDTGATDLDPIEWDLVRDLFADSDTPDKKARRVAASALQMRYEYIYLDTEEDLLKYYEDDGVFERGGERHVKQVLVRELEHHFSTHDRNEILAMIQDDCAVDVEDLNAAEDDRRLLCLANGVLNLDSLLSQTGPAGLDDVELLDHSPEFKFTRSVPVEFDPSAVATSTEEFLAEIVETDGQKQTLEEMMGAALHPEYLKSKFLFLFGEGSNGKGIYFELISKLLGDRNVEGRGLHELANERFAKADLHGKLANIGGDIDDRKLKNVGELKRLTSGTDVVTAERKYGQPFKFVNSATLFFAANEPPAIEDQKRSMARRLVPIRMPYQFVENPSDENPYEKPARDEDELLSEMTTDEELAGLLNLALRGMKRLHDQGDVSLERGPMERLEHYQRFSDPIYRFATECMVKESGETVQKEDVYEIYKEFSSVEGHAVRHNSVFWREFKRVFHVEETRPRDADGNKGPRQLVGTGFSEVALERYAPQKLAAKYVPVTDDDDDDDDGAMPASTRFDPVPLADAAEDATGFPTVECEVVEVNQPENENAPALSATVKDDSSAMRVISWDDPCALSEGDGVVIENAEATTYDGSTQLVLKSGVTEVHDKPEDGQSQLGSQNRAAADGGTQADERSAEGWEPDEDATGVRAAANRLVATLKASDTEAMSRGDLCKATAGRYPSQGYDASELENALDVAISEEGWLVEDEKGVRRP